MKTVSDQNQPQNEQQIKVYRNLMFDFRICRGVIKTKRKQISVKPEPKKLKTEEMEVIKEKKRLQKEKIENEIQKAKLKFRGFGKSQIELMKVRPQGVLRVTKGIYVDHYERLQTDILQKVDQYTNTDFILHKRAVDLSWDFPYGVDKEIQVIESEIFDFDKEVQAKLALIVQEVLQESLQEIKEEFWERFYLNQKQIIENRKLNQINLIQEKIQEQLELKKEYLIQKQDYEQKQEEKRLAQKKLLCTEMSRVIFKQNVEDFWFVRIQKDLKQTVEQDKKILDIKKAVQQMYTIGLRDQKQVQNLIDEISQQLNENYKKINIQQKEDYRIKVQNKQQKIIQQQEKQKQQIEKQKQLKLIERKNKQKIKLEQLAIQLLDYEKDYSFIQDKSLFIYDLEESNQQIREQNYIFLIEKGWLEVLLYLQQENTSEIVQENTLKQFLQFLQEQNIKNSFQIKVNENINYIELEKSSSIQSIKQNNQEGLYLKLLQESNDQFKKEKLFIFKYLLDNDQEIKIEIIRNQNDNWTNINTIILNKQALDINSQEDNQETNNFNKGNEHLQALIYFNNKDKNIIKSKYKTLDIWNHLFLYQKIQEFHTNKNFNNSELKLKLCQSLAQYLDSLKDQYNNSEHVKSIIFYSKNTN